MAAKATPFRESAEWIPYLGADIVLRGRRNQPVPRSAHHFPRRLGRTLLLEFHSRSAPANITSHSCASGRCARRLPFQRPVSLLPFLGSNAGARVFLTSPFGAASVAWLLPSNSFSTRWQAPSLCFWASWPSIQRGKNNGHPDLRHSIAPCHRAAISRFHEILDFLGFFLRLRDKLPCFRFIPGCRHAYRSPPRLSPSCLPGSC